MSIGTIDPRVTTFRSKKIKHPSLNLALRDIFKLVRNARTESVIVLLGPSGVGKSTIIETLERELLAQYAEQLQSDPGFLPFISIKAAAPLDGHFNWKDLFIRMLHMAGEVLIRRKVVSHFEVELDGDTFPSAKGLVREELRRSLESLVRHRNVKLLILDEASAILRVRSGISHLLQFEILKSLAIELKIPIILVGAYDLLGVLEGSGQLVRRSEVIHLQRYAFGRSTDKASDEDIFGSVLKSFLEAMPISKEPHLLDHTDFFLARSIGCVGILKSWLERALVEALATPGEVLTRDILEATALSRKKLALLLKEAMAGELRLEDFGDDDLAALLGLGYTPSLRLTAPLALDNQIKEKKKRSGRVGQRGPSRDPVGGLNV
jgi:energy-coupling factor transporter ATP-binding protein EcfA2